MEDRLYNKEYNNFLENIKLFETKNGRMMELYDMNMLEIKLLQKYDISEYNRLISIKHYLNCKEQEKIIKYEQRLQNKEGVCDKCELPKIVLYNNVYDSYEDGYFENCIGCKECIMKAFET